MILVCGDIHGYWSSLNTLINKKSPSMILQCGDFGYWPKFHGQSIDGTGKKWDFYGLKNQDTKIYWCDGNHEDHWGLKNVSNNEILPNVFYMKRGSALTLPDGRNILFIGGAQSIDRFSRTTGVDWFPEETITQKEIYDLPDVNIDIIISHTCPEEFLCELGFEDYRKEKYKDPSCKALSYVLEKYRPSLWYFGHFHVSKSGYTSRCRWTCLNQESEYGWWKKLED